MVTTAAQDRSSPPGTRAAAASIGVGLVVGAATSAGQTLLGGTAFAGLANAASPWLVAPFLLASRTRTWRRAVALGILACLAEVGGYYLTSAARGFGVNPVTVAVWCGAAGVGGAVFGLAGSGWRTAGGRGRGLGAALLVAVWLCEAVVTYAVVLHDADDAVLFAAVAVVLWVLLGRPGRQHVRILGWLPPVLTAGVGGELLLHALL